MRQGKYGRKMRRQFWREEWPDLLKKRGTGANSWRKVWWAQLPRKTHTELAKALWNANEWYVCDYGQDDDFSCEELRDQMDDDYGW